jgi:hypothetical protein
LIRSQTSLTKDSSPEVAAAFTATVLRGSHDEARAVSISGRASGTGKCWTK